MIDELRRDVERLRKEVETRAQSSRQESHDLSLVVQEVLQLLRRLAMRPWGPGRQCKSLCRSRYQNASGIAAPAKDPG